MNLAGNIVIDVTPSQRLTVQSYESRTRLARLWLGMRLLLILGSPSLWKRSRGSIDDEGGIHERDNRPQSLEDVERSFRRINDRYTWKRVFLFAALLIWLFNAYAALPNLRSDRTSPFGSSPA